MLSFIFLYVIYVINYCLNIGAFPNIRKAAVITPIPKISFLKYSDSILSAVKKTFCLKPNLASVHSIAIILVFLISLIMPFFNPLNPMVLVHT